MIELKKGMVLKDHDFLPFLEKINIQYYLNKILNMPTFKTM